MSIRHLLAALALGLTTVAASAQSITVEQPRTRATGAAQKTGGAWLTLKNAGADDRLVGASTPVAASVELHSMTMDGDVMRMRQVDGIAVPAGKSVELKPGGLHLMLIGLKQPLAAGSQFPLTLRFAKAGEVPVTVKVEGGSQDAGAHKH